MATTRTTLGNFPDTTIAAKVAGGTLSGLLAGTDCASRASTEAAADSPGAFEFWVRGGTPLPSMRDSGTASITVQTLASYTTGDVVLLDPACGVVSTGPNVWRMATILAAP